MLHWTRIRTAILVALLSLSMAGPTAFAATPAGSGGNGSGFAVFGNLTSCGAGRMCVSLSASGCAGDCFVYNANGNASQWAGRSDTTSDAFWNGYTVGLSGSGVNNNNTGTNRKGCFYGAFNYSTTFGTSVLLAGVGWRSSTNTSSIAAIPTSGGWFC